MDHSILPLVTLLKLDDIDFLNIKRKHFRQAIISQVTQHITSSNRTLATPIPWSRFWNLSITTIARNVWVLLHKFLPQSFPPDVPDTMDHFLYHCPPELAVWSRVYQDLLLANCTTDSISKSLFRLQFPPSPPTIASAIAISITLECIWKAHWRVVFDHVPFVPSLIFLQVQRIVAQRIDAGSLVLEH